MRNAPHTGQIRSDQISLCPATDLISKIRKVSPKTRPFSQITSLKRGDRLKHARISQIPTTLYPIADRAINRGTTTRRRISAQNTARRGTDRSGWRRRTSPQKSPKSNHIHKKRKTTQITKRTRGRHEQRKETFFSPSEIGRAHV